LVDRLGVDNELWEIIKKRIDSGHESKLYAKEIFLLLIESYRERFKQESHIIPLEKTPGHVFNMDRILALYSKSKILLMRRNPRDYANSMRKCYWAPETITGIADLWEQTIRKIDELHCAHKRSVNVIDYEDLVGQPEKVISDVFKFLGLPYSENYLKDINAGANEIVLPSEKEWKENNLTIHGISNSRVTIILGWKNRIKMLFQVLPTAIRYYGFRHLKV